jgi:hypothetical protein
MPSQALNEKEKHPRQKTKPNKPVAHAQKPAQTKRAWKTNDDIPVKAI